MLWCSQVASGCENGLRLRVYGTKVGIEWAQEDPNYLWVTPYGAPRYRLTRGGAGSGEAAARMRTLIHETSHQGDTLGGVFEVVATGMFPGLGSHVQWDRKLDGRIAQGLMSLQAIKGVEMGDGFAAAQRSGSTVHDAIEIDAKSGRFPRSTNRAGGVEGGMSNGEDLVCRAAMKPIATLKKALRSVDLRTLEPVDAAFERSDICAVAAASVVGEAIVAWVLAEALLEKFGSDSIRELTRNLEGYRAQLRDFATI